MQMRDEGEREERRQGSGVGDCRVLLFHQPDDLL